MYLSGQFQFDGQVLQAFWQTSQKSNQYYTAARKTVTDPKVPAEPANCCSGIECVFCTSISLSHLHTPTHPEVHRITLFTHSHTRAQTPACTDSQAWADKNAHIQKHPREGYSKWTSQPSKALTSIRHAFTVWLPTDGESHLSARASAKQFQSDRNHFMHICIYSMPNSLALFLITPTCAIYCNCVNCETICVFWMTLFSDGDFPTWNSCCTDTLS